MNEEIRSILIEKSEVAYRDFSAALIPKSKPLLGVRLPILRKLAKELVKKGDWETEINKYDGNYQDIYFEETMLRGLLIGYGTEKEDADVALGFVGDFIPYIDNWSVCDSFCNSVLFVARNREKVWDFLQNYLCSDKEFEVRVAVIILLNYFLKYDKNGKKMTRRKVITMEDVARDTRQESVQNYPYLERIVEVLNREYNQGYYAQMAVAWTTAEAFVCFPYEIMQMLRYGCNMDVWTYNKALQKICESKNPDDKVKQYIKAMKR